MFNELLLVRFRFGRFMQKLIIVGRPNGFRLWTSVGLVGNDQFRQSNAGYSDVTSAIAVRILLIFLWRQTRRIVVIPTPHLHIKNPLTSMTKSDEFCLLNFVGCWSSRAKYHPRQLFPQFQLILLLQIAVCYLSLHNLYSSRKWVIRKQKAFISPHPQISIVRSHFHRKLFESRSPSCSLAEAQWINSRTDKQIEQVCANSGSTTNLDLRVRERERGRKGVPESESLSAIGCSSNDFKRDAANSTTLQTLLPLPQPSLFTIIYGDCCTHRVIKRS